MRLGFHLSISGGLTRAIEQGVRTGCETAQVFSRNPRGWTAKPISDRDSREFRRARISSGLDPLAVHLPYLPNLAARAGELRQKSITVLSEEMHRAAALGADYVVAHSGHVARDMDREEALARVVAGVLEALSGTDSGNGVLLLLENTAGQRGELGAGFEELGLMAEEIEAGGSPVGVCLDIAHAWGAGYDWSRARSQEEVLTEFNRVVGLDRLKLVHFNDSMVGLGTRRDRHAPVGKGKIGSRAMSRLVRHPAFAGLGGIMETPSRTEADDVANMLRAKKWRDETRGSPRSSLG